jgi:CheY-like chemotaxis protein
MVLSKVDSNLVLALMKNMPTEDSVPLEKLSVLIVDDSAMVRRVTGNLVSDLGHTFTAVADGEKAVQLVASGAQYDVILMDNQMPVMTGVDATRIIRDTHGYKGIILGVTGNTLEEDIMEFKHAGANKVIMKPLLKESFQNGVLSERKAATKPSALPL